MLTSNPNYIIKESPNLKETSQKPWYMIRIFYILQKLT